MLKKYFSVVLLAGTLLFSLNAKVVNVGYYIDAGTFMSGKSENEPKFGYAYDYLQTIASYTGWTYNYKYGYFQDLYKSLLSGEIDILVDISYTPERAEKILFSEYPIATETYYLYSNSTFKDLTPDNLEALNGKTIALGEGTYQYSLLMEWLEKHNIKLDIDLIPYEQVTERDFNDGKYDLYLSIDLVTDFDWEPVAKIGASEIYVAVNMNRPDILSELNDAQNALYISNPYFNDDLWLTFFGDSFKSKKLSRRDHQWLYQNQLLDIGCLKQDKMFASKDLRTGEVRGLVPFMMEHFKDMFDVPNQKFSYHFYNDMNEIDAALDSGEIDFAFPAIYDLEAAEKRNQSLSKRVVRNSLLFICSVNDFDFSELAKRKVIIAVPENCRTGDYVVRKNIIRDAKYVYYANHEDCLDAVLLKTADAAIFPSTNASVVLHEKRKYKNLYSTEIHDKASFSFVTKRNNIELISVLNKLISNIPVADIELEMLNESIITQKISVKKIFSDYFIVIIFILIFVVILIFGFFVSLGHLRILINYDVLTHLLNRRTLSVYMKNAFYRARNYNEDFSIMIFDLDDFKQINDNYGHAFGDEVLKIAADTISKGIKRTDFAFRWGGEEFLVLLKANKDVACCVAERIRGELVKQNILYNNEKITITVTVGVASYTSDITETELFAKADRNLYIGKNNGKNQVVF